MIVVADSYSVVRVFVSAFVVWLVQIVSWQDTFWWEGGRRGKVGEKAKGKGRVGKKRKYW
jgi:hypothetical protein